MPTFKEMIETLSKVYKPDDVIAYDAYNVADVLDRCRDIGRPDVTAEQAEQALEDMHHHKDCNYGFSWDVLDCYLPPRPVKRGGGAP
jgi:hypothetical protein